MRLPLVGSFLHWRHARLAMQLPLLGLAVLVVVHGLLGPQLAPRNLATVLTSIHWRGLLIVALLAVGNLFCTGCPMMLVRDAGRRFYHPARRWPRWLRGKWLAIALLVLVLFTYELFDLWSLPRATAWLVLGYFGLALVVDVVFAGASFCKHLCPIGQLNFVASTMSPTELRVSDLSTCRSCRTADCIKGHYGVVERGLEPPRPVERRLPPSPRLRRTRSVCLIAWSSIHVRRITKALSQSALDDPHRVVQNRCSTSSPNVRLSWSTRVARRTPPSHHAESRAA